MHRNRFFQVKRAYLMHTESCDEENHQSGTYKLQEPEYYHSIQEQ